MDKEEINQKTFEMIDNKNIKSIEIRTIGLLDVFGKIEIDIIFKNNSKKHLIGISPVDTTQIQKWLKKIICLKKQNYINFKKEKIMPEEKNEKCNIYYKSQNDKEYKKLGIGTIENNLSEAEEKEISKMSFELEGEYTFNIKTKKYRRKRFKKLLMSRGVQRNEAEIYSRIYNRTQFELDMFF